METIICAATHCLINDKVYYGHRHNHCRDAMNDELSWTMNREQISKVEKIQGFVTSSGRFVDRKEGAKIWIKLGGVLKFSSEELYSEDLY